MPTTPENPVTVEALLRLKRHECPDDAFWDKFDRDFERRRLQALVNDNGSEGRISWVRLRRMALGTGFASVVLGMALIGTERFGGGASGAINPEAGSGSDVISANKSPVGAGESGRFGEERLQSLASVDTGASNAYLSRGLVSPQFVVDVLSTRLEEDHFDRVLANPEIQGPRRHDAVFVADPLTGGDRYRSALLLDRSLGQF